MESNDDLTQKEITVFSEHHIESYSITSEVENENITLEFLNKFKNIYIYIDRCRWSLNIIIIYSYRESVLVGRRIVDIGYIFKQIQSTSHDIGLGCTFINIKFVSESRNGYFSKFKFKCQMCNKNTVISSDPSESFPINEAITNGTIAIGKI